MSNRTSPRRIARRQSAELGRWLSAAAPAVTVGIEGHVIFVETATAEQRSEPADSRG